MKILSIAGILPIPGLLTSNDFVYQTYLAYKEQYTEDSVVIIRPTQYKTNIKKIIRKETELYKINKNFTWNIYNFRVEIYPFYSSRLLRDIHVILTYSAFLLNRRKLYSLLKEHKFDVTHAQYIFPDGLLAYILYKKFKIPYTVTSHNELCYFRFPFSRYIGKKILKNAYRVLPINFRNFNYFKEIGLTNVEILPLGFNKSFIRDQKPSSEDIIKIVTVCELIPLKNVDKVLLAIARLVKKYNLKYTVIGRGSEKEKLLNLTSELGIQDYVDFLDHVPHDQIADEIYKNDIFIMPSYIETFGRVYFEAMAMGIPIICAKNSGIHGYYKELEEAVTVVHHDIDDITEKLKMLIANRDLRTTIGLNGQKLVVNYTWENIAKKLHNLYLEATKK